MIVAFDTNVLLRVITEDDPRQSAIAGAELQRAEVVVLASSALCELVWVLSRGYHLATDEIARALRVLVNARNVVCDRGAVEAGLAQLDAGGDFADAVIAYEGSSLGASLFVSFDRAAVKILAKQGRAVRLLT